MSSEPLLPEPPSSPRSALSSQRAALSHHTNLAHLSTGVSATKSVANALAGEVRSQNSLLDALANDVSSGQRRGLTTLDRTNDAAAAGNAYNWRTFCLLLWPLVLLIVLIVKAVLHFVF